jgi:hypothetical protein
MRPQENPSIRGKYWTVFNAAGNVVFQGPSVKRLLRSFIGFPIPSVEGRGPVRANSRPPGMSLIDTILGRPLASNEARQARTAPGT